MTPTQRPGSLQSGLRSLPRPAVSESGHSGEQNPKAKLCCRGQAAPGFVLWEAIVFIYILHF